MYETPVEPRSSEKLVESSRSHEAEVDVPLELEAADVPLEMTDIALDLESSVPDIDVVDLEETAARALQEEMATYDTYLRTIPLYLQLAEAVAKTKMPDLRRPSAVMPPAIDVLLDQTVSELRQLSLNKNADPKNLKHVLEQMIKRDAIQDRVVELKQWMAASEKRLARLQAEKPALDQRALEEARRALEERQAAALVAKMKAENHMKPMPQPVSSAPSLEQSQNGILNRMKSWFR